MSGCSRGGRRCRDKTATLVFVVLIVVRFGVSAPDVPACPAAAPAPAAQRMPPKTTGTSSRSSWPAFWRIAVSAQQQTKQRRYRSSRRVLFGCRPGERRAKAITQPVLPPRRIRAERWPIRLADRFKRLAGHAICSLRACRRRPATMTNTSRCRPGPGEQTSR